MHELGSSSSSTQAAYTNTTDHSNRRSTCHPPLGVRTIKHIPKPVSPNFASTLVDTLDKVVSSPNDDNAWTDLFNFGSRFLCLSDRGGKRQNLFSILIKQFNGGSIDSDSHQSTSLSFRKKSPEATKETAVSSKFKNDNVSATFRILCSDDTPAVFSTDNLEKLKHKHPSEHNEIRVPTSPDGMQALQACKTKCLVLLGHSLPALLPVQMEFDINIFSRWFTPAKWVSSSHFRRRTANLRLVGNCFSDEHILFGGKLLALDKSQGASIPYSSAICYDGWPLNVPGRTSTKH